MQFTKLLGVEIATPGTVQLVDATFGGNGKTIWGTVIGGNGRTPFCRSRKSPALARFFGGAPGGIRTHDPRLRRPLLYPAELLARIGASRFERPTPCSQGRCATRLRYAPASCKLKLRELTITAPGAKAQAENKPRRSESPSAGLTLTFARALRQKASRRQTKNKLLRRRRCLERFHQWPNALILRFSRHPMGTLRP